MKNRAHFSILPNDAEPWARNLKHLLELAAVLRERDIDLFVLKHGIDSSLPWAG
jgi:hypothetical protein